MTIDSYHWWQEPELKLNTNGKTTRIGVMNLVIARLVQNSFKLIKLITNRVHTDKTYEIVISIIY